MKKRLFKLGSFVLAGVLCGSMAATSVLAEEKNTSAGFTVSHDEHRALTVDAGEEKPSADLTVGLYSQYIWRGWELSRDSLVIQPSMTVSYKGFSANVWGNMDTDTNENLYGDETSDWNETDFTLSYDGSAGMVGYTLGYIYYALDGVGSDTQEFYAGASLETLLVPTLTVYRDTDAAPGWYITLGVSHSFPVTKKYSLDLGLQVSYWDVDDESTYEDHDGDSYSNFHDGILSAAMSFPMGEYLTITPELNYVFPLSDDAEDFMEDNSVSGDDNDFIYGGVSLSFAF